MPRISYSYRPGGGWPVGVQLSGWIKSLRWHLGSWLRVSAETGVALSTVRLIRRQVREPRTVKGAVHSVEEETYLRIGAAFKRVLGRRVQPGRPGPFIPRLDGVEA